MVKSKGGQVMTLLTIKSLADRNWGSAKTHDELDGYRLTRFGFFNTDEIDQACEGSHCYCSHDCCGCWNTSAYYVPIAFGLGYIVEHHYMNV